MIRKSLKKLERKKELMRIEEMTRSSLLMNGLDLKLKISIKVCKVEVQMILNHRNNTLFHPKKLHRHLLKIPLRIYFQRAQEPIKRNVITALSLIIRDLIVSIVYLAAIEVVSKPNTIIPLLMHLSCLSKTKILQSLRSLIILIRQPTKTSLYNL